MQHRLATLTATRSAAILLSTTLGLANAVALLGWSVIDPRNIGWLTADNATHYLGWAFYRYETGLTIPLGWTERVGYPVGASIAFLDSVPLVAVLLRPLSPLLPEPFQYLGLYAALCFVLQIYFGLKLCRTLFREHQVLVVIGGLFFLLSPPLTWLVFGHFPHLSHWLILAALEYYLRDIGPSAFRWFLPQWLLLAIAAGINPYLAAMGLLIALAALARMFLERRVAPITGAVLFGTTLIVLAASLFAVGFLVAQPPATYVGHGYGEFSMNLLAPINPLHYGSILIPPLPVAGIGQFEGYNYLGLGVLILLILNLLRRPRIVLDLLSTKLAPLVALAVVCTLAAMSSTVTLGSMVLAQFDLPSGVLLAAQSLRVSGRFFWPVHYLLVLAAVWMTCALWKPRIRIPLLVAGLAIQTADVWTLRRLVRANVDLPVENPLLNPAWRDLGRDHDTLMVIPPYQCGPHAAPGGKRTYAVFGKLAASQKMRTNSYYAARYTKDEIRIHCLAVPNGLVTGKAFDRETAYVVSPEVRSLWEASPDTPLRCDTVDGFNLCTTRTPGSPAPPRPTLTTPAYAPGDLLDFTRDGSARRFMVYGWASDSGDDGTWTVGGLAKLRLRLAAPVATDLTLTLVEGSRAFVAKLHPRLDVDVKVNGQVVERWSFQYGSARAERRARIPRTVLQGRSELDVEFQILNPEAPGNVGEGPDDRLLGLNVRGLVLRGE